MQYVKSDVQRRCKKEVAFNVPSVGVQVFEIHMKTEKRWKLEQISLITSLIKWRCQYVGDS